jgi:hypothetical protein
MGCLYQIGVVGKRKSDLRNWLIVLFRGGTGAIGSPSDTADAWVGFGDAVVFAADGAPIFGNQILSIAAY